MKISNNPSYISKVVKLEIRLKNSILDEKQKIYLLNMLQERKNTIAKEHKAELISLFEQKIRAREGRSVLDMPIEDLSLLEKTKKYLLKDGICTVGQILNKSKRDLMDIRFVGSFVINEIIEKLVSLGFNIPDKDDVKIQEVNDFDTETIEIDNDTFYRTIINEIESVGLDEGSINYLLSRIHEIEVSAEKEHQKELLDFFESHILPKGQFLSNNTSIEELEFPIRLLNALKANGLDTVDKIMEKSKLDLMSMENISKKSVNEIFEKIRSFGYIIPEDEGITIKEHNGMRDTIYCKKIDVERLIEEIQKSDLNEMDESYLLSVLLQRAIFNLQSAYNALDILILEHNQLRKQAVQHMEKQNYLQENERIEKIKEEQSIIRAEMENVLSLD